jgi:hypothetical protein
MDEDFAGSNTISPFAHLTIEIGSALSLHVQSDEIGRWRPDRQQSHLLLGLAAGSPNGKPGDLIRPQGHLR